VLNRQRPFHELDIDFATLERRKANEYEKLNHVVRYAVTHGCRQWEILRYFGDPHAGACGHCDNCGRLPPRERPAGAADGEEPVLRCVRMALSGVARAQGRVGKGLVVKMLCGSRSQQLRKLRFDQLSTFGLLARLSQEEVTALLDALLDAGLVEQTDVQRLRPVVKLTLRGRQVMTGQLPLDGAFRISARLGNAVNDFFAGIGVFTSSKI
jgi:ATP-dependent DNA helicase RecQ